MKKILQKEKKILRTLCSRLSLTTSDQLPLFCDICITDQCFFRCKICDIWKHKNTEETLTKENWINFLNDLKGFLGNKSIIVNFAGGEPLLINFIPDLIYHCRKLGFNTSMCTNGYLLDKEMVKKICDAGLHFIALSLDSINPETHNYLRGMNDSQQRVLKAIELLQNFKETGVGLRTIICHYNIKDLKDLVIFTKETPNLRHIDFQVISRPAGTIKDDLWFCRDEMKWLWPNDKIQLDEFNKKFDQLVKMKIENYPIANSEIQLSAFKNYFNNPTNFVNPSMNCHLDFHHINVTNHGDAFLCHDHYSIGNILKSNIKEIWSSKKAFDVRKSIISCKKNCYLLLNCCYDEYEI